MKLLKSALFLLYILAASAMHGAPTTLKTNNVCISNTDNNPLINIEKDPIILKIQRDQSLTEKEIFKLKNERDSMGCTRLALAIIWRLKQETINKIIELGGTIYLNDSTNIQEQLLIAQVTAFNDLNSAKAVLKAIKEKGSD